MKIEICKHEDWRQIPGYPMYEISNIGNVRSYWGRLGRGLGWGLKAESILLKRSINSRTGYPTATLKDGDGNKKQTTVHSLVMLTFVGPRPSTAPYVRHLNGFRNDPRLANLAYGSASENEADKVYHGTVASPLKAVDVMRIRELIKSGVSESSLASDFHVTPRTIRRINLRQRWASI